MLQKTLAQVIFVLFETEPDSNIKCGWDGLLNIVKEAVASENRFHFKWTKGGGLLTMKERLRKPLMVRSLRIRGTFLEVFALDVVENHFNAAVGFKVAIVYGSFLAVATGGFCCDAFAVEAAKSIVQYDVRFLAGVFGESTQLQKLCVATGRANEPFFQSWWKAPTPEHPREQVVESDAAVAARFGLQRKGHSSKYGAYPAFIIVFGPCQDSTRAFQFPSLITLECFDQSSK